MNIFIKHEGRLGNNLFQYFFAKLLAEKTKSNFYTSFTLPAVFGLDYKTFQHLPSTYCILSEKWSGFDMELTFNGKKINENFDDILREIHNSKCENLVINGYFQQVSYYMEEMENIKKAFKYQFSNKKNILGVHIRKGDIKNSINDLPDLWFIESVKKFPNHRKIITTDSPNDNIIKELTKLGCEIYNNSPENTILEFANYDDLILSQGTFSWWIGFLSEGTKHNLIPNTGWNSIQSRTKLLPIHEKWKYYKLESNNLKSI